MSNTTNNNSNKSSEETGTGLEVANVQTEVYDPYTARERREPASMSNIPPDVLYEIAAHLIRPDRSALRATHPGYEALLRPEISPFMLLWVNAEDTEYESAMQTLRSFRNAMNREDTRMALREMSFSLKLRDKRSVLAQGAITPRVANEVGLTCQELIPRWTNLKVLMLNTHMCGNIGYLATRELIRYLTNENSNPKPHTLILNQTHLIDLTRPQHWVWVDGRNRVLEKNWFPVMRPKLWTSRYCGQGHIWWKLGEVEEDDGKGGRRVREIGEGWYYIYWHPRNRIHPGEDFLTLESPRDDETELTYAAVLDRDENDEDDGWGL